MAKKPILTRAQVPVETKVVQVENEDNVSRDSLEFVDTQSEVVEANEDIESLPEVIVDEEQQVVPEEETVVSPTEDKEERPLKPFDYDLREIAVKGSTSEKETETVKPAPVTEKTTQVDEAKKVDPWHITSTQADKAVKDIPATFVDLYVGLGWTWKKIPQLLSVCPPTKESCKSSGIRDQCAKLLPIPMRQGQAALFFPQYVFALCNAYQIEE